MRPSYGINLTLGHQGQMRVNGRALVHTTVVRYKPDVKWSIQPCPSVALLDPPKRSIVGLGQKIKAQGIRRPSYGLKLTLGHQSQVMVKGQYHPVLTPYTHINDQP